MQECDVIAVLDRFSTPFILRAPGELEGKRTLIGACYVLGIMGGEVNLEATNGDLIQCLEIA